MSEKHNLADVLDGLQAKGLTQSELDELFWLGQALGEVESGAGNDDLSSVDDVFADYVEQGLMTPEQAEKAAADVPDADPDDPAKALLESEAWLFESLDKKGITQDDLERLQAAARRARERSQGLVLAKSCDLAREPETDLDRELVGPLLVRGSRTLLAAHTGEGKTTFSLQLVAAALRGDEFLGWRGRGRSDLRALYIDAEQGKQTLKRRLREAGLDDCEALDIVRAPDGLDLDREASPEADALEAVFAGYGYDVVIADPLYKLHRGDSNDERAATDLMRRLDGWRERYGFALLVPTHCRKPLQGGGGKLTIHDLFGSSAYVRGPEIVLGLERLADGYARLHVFKDRDGDLEVGARWRLLFDREHRFRLDPSEGKRKETATDKVRAALEDEPGLTKDELEERTGYRERTIKDALRELEAVSDGKHPARYRLPENEDA